MDESLSEGSQVITASSPAGRRAQDGARVSTSFWNLSKTAQLAIIVALFLAVLLILWGIPSPCTPP